MHQSFSLNEKEKKECVALARRAIKYFFETKELLKPTAVSEKLKEKKSSFVTLMKNGRLRGCIGHLEANQPLYCDIIESAVSAAFQDPRFPPVEEEEFGNIKVEVSILTDPIEIAFSTSGELLKKIVPEKDGLIIQKDCYSATFLPSVWDEIKTKEEFLGHLCMKAGLGSDAWKEPGMKVLRYGTIKTLEKKT